MLGCFDTESDCVSVFGAWTGPTAAGTSFIAKSGVLLIGVGFRLKFRCGNGGLICGGGACGGCFRQGMPVGRSTRRIKFSLPYAVTPGAFCVPKSLQDTF